MEEKVKIIDEICSFHPAQGVDKGWSWYVGGMKDDGGWHFRKMLDVPIEELKAFLSELEAEKNKPARQLTEEEKELSKQIVRLPSGGWATQLFIRDWENYCKERDLRILFASGVISDEKKKD